MSSWTAASSSSSSVLSKGIWGGIFQNRISEELLWRENIYGGWATLIALISILVWQSFRFFYLSSNRSTSLSSSPFKSKSESPLISSSYSPVRIAGIVTDADLKNLIDNLDEKLCKNEKWDNVIDRKNSVMSYNAKCCKPKDGPLKYLSVTVFENCSPEKLRDFYMDNDYRKQWDKTVVDHAQLQVDEASGTEVGRTIKKFPLLTPREYVLAWRLWEGKDKTFYCFIRECEHPSAPKHKKYVRVGFFRSGWRIRKVPGRNACEIKLVHQEDAGLNVEMAKLAFARGIWSYVCKMDTALRKYSATSPPQQSSAVTAITLVQKVPPELDAITSSIQAGSASSSAIQEITAEAKERKLFKKPSSKTVAKGLLLLGGVACLSHGHSLLGAKIAMAYILSKLNKRGSLPTQNSDMQS